MRFKTMYYNEAMIYHPISNGEREVLHTPQTAPIPDDIQGKRLVTIVNTDGMYFTFIFDPKAKDPLAMMQGSYKNPVGNIIPMPKDAAKIYHKHYTPQDPNDEYPNPTKYRGEVRIHPPFDGYKEFPQDANAVFFTDFENKDAVYYAGDTIDDELRTEE